MNSAFALINLSSTQSNVADLSDKLNGISSTIVDYCRMFEQIAINNINQVANNATVTTELIISYIMSIELQNKFDEMNKMIVRHITKLEDNTEFTIMWLVAFFISFLFGIFIYVFTNDECFMKNDTTKLVALERVVKQLWENNEALEKKVSKMKNKIVQMRKKEKMLVRELTQTIMDHQIELDNHTMNYEDLNSKMDTMQMDIDNVTVGIETLEPIVEQLDYDIYHNDIFENIKDIEDEIDYLKGNIEYEISDVRNTIKMMSNCLEDDLRKVAEK